MASSINTNSLDAQYPVAGVDNDSQGFRDNFGNIKDNLNFAKTEITTLQEDTAKTNADNDFNGNQITGANLIANTQEVYNGGNLSASQNVDFNNGHYQVFAVSGTDSITLTLTGWPEDGKLGKMRIVLTGDGSNTTPIIWASTGGKTIRYDSNFPSPFNVSSDTAPLILDFWASDGPNAGVVYGQYIGSFSS